MYFVSSKHGSTTVQNLRHELHVELYVTPFCYARLAVAWLLRFGVFGVELSSQKKRSGEKPVAMKARKLGGSKIVASEGVNKKNSRFESLMLFQSVF